MRNTTIVLDEQTLEDAKKYASSLGMSFNAWIKKIIREAIKPDRKKLMSDVLKLADQAPGNSKGKRWKREDIYER